MLGQVSKKDVSRCVDISSSSVAALLTHVDLGPSQFSVDVAAGTASLAGIVFANDDDPARRILLRLVQQTLAEAEMRPGVHHSRCFVTDTPLLGSLCHTRGLEGGDEDGIVVSAQPQGGLPVHLVHDVANAFTQPRGGPLHVGALFVSMEEIRRSPTWTKRGATTLQLVQMLTQPQETALILLYSELESTPHGIKAGLKRPHSGVERDDTERV